MGTLRVIRFTALLVTLIFAACPTFAGWEVTFLDPGTNQGMRILGMSGQQQVGEAAVGNVMHASVWNGSSSSWVDLHPTGAVDSLAWGCSSGRQVGEVSFWDGVGLREHASLWSGSAASWIDLNPVGYVSSHAYATSGGWQVGESGMAGMPSHAGIWHGTAESWADLHPNGYTGSKAYAISGGQQGGCALLDGHAHAGIWSGTAESWVDMNPIGFVESTVKCMCDGQQVGWASGGQGYRAGYWTGTAESWVNISPPNCYGSYALAASNGWQVGAVAREYSPYYGPMDVAALWHGTAASWVNLQSLLPSGSYFDKTYASGVQVMGEEIWVAGWGERWYVPGPDRGVLWHYTPDAVPEPSSLLILGGGVLGLMGLVRKTRNSKSEIRNNQTNA